MKDVEDNNVYLALDDNKSDQFILKQNLAALIANKNAVLESVAQEVTSIPAALVRLKWQNRREIYALQIKEEIYGAAINAIIKQNPALRDKIMARLESTWQHFLARETATLRLTRKLAEGNYRTITITTVALNERLVQARSDRQ
ncbi:cytoplasmic protein [Citrobacter farmeri]|uniref:cytoplasmic protein n=1 Tax=Citrobacter farmeri TaxID=67824 RepID=UPI00190652C8|nr:cytoplasmic protein [Citrobacter farmeri]EKV7299171.1 cytoplasmic protein [Citrobacter farmeri]EKW5933149.1 cytoplasmic protein [Citrobacter farmeri]MBJ8747078.1 cytoplasmic protein [Citrobacter farmeri]MBJ8761236.1 cytoplasmic protein [Citrobacter farmeri]MBJ9020791.1 cytoplasmic protein [Citrobacter farmeri]